MREGNEWMVGGRRREEGRTADGEAREWNGEGKKRMKGVGRGWFGEGRT